MATVSVVIPAYNAAASLGSTIRSLFAQSVQPHEVVVADDGSDDDTASVVASLATSLPQVHLVRVPRDERSGRSRARNRGAAAASGDHLLFLDSAWHLEPGLLAQAQAMLDGSTVLLVPFGRGDADDESATERPDQIDERWGYFAANQGDLSRLSCPWLLGWTGAMFVPRTAFEQIRGFDEEFLGWGAEDLEFSLRLFRAGARFRALLAPCAFRSYGLRTAPERLQQLDENVRRIQVKHSGIETEILNAVGQTYATSLIERLAHLPLDYLVQELEEEALQSLRGFLPVGSRLMVGVPPHLARELDASDLLAHSVSAETKLGRLRPHSKVHRRLGLALPFADSAFASAVCTDFVRAFTPHVQVPMLRELVRVARDPLLVCSVRETPHSIAVCRAAFREVAGFQLASLDELHRAALAAGIMLRPIYRSHYSVVFALAAKEAR